MVLCRCKYMLLKLYGYLTESGILSVSYDKPCNSQFTITHCNWVERLCVNGLAQISCGLKKKSSVRTLN